MPNRPRMESKPSRKNDSFFLPAGPVNEAVDEPPDKAGSDAPRANACAVNVPRQQKPCTSRRKKAEGYASPQRARREKHIKDKVDQALCSPWLARKP